MTDIEQPKEVEVKIDNTTVQILQTIQEWHANSNEQLMTLIDNAKLDVVLDLGPDLKIKLTEEMASGFKTGLLICKSLFGTLPFTLTPPEEPANPDAPVTDAEVLEGV